MSTEPTPPDGMKYVRTYMLGGYPQHVFIEDKSSPSAAVPLELPASPSGEDGERGGGSVCPACKGLGGYPFCGTCHNAKPQKPPPQDPVEWVKSKLFQILDSLQSGTRLVLDGDYALELAHRCREAEVNEQQAREGWQTAEVALDAWMKKLRNEQGLRLIALVERDDLRAQLADEQAKVAELEERVTNFKRAIG